MKAPHKRKMSGPAPELAPLLRAPEAANLLAISKRKLWELTNCGEIPCVRFGRSVRYDPMDLAAFMESHKCRGPH